MLKQRIIKFLDILILICIYGVLFTSTFSKAAIESLVGSAIFFWLLKKALSIGSGGWFRSFFPSTPLNMPLAIFALVNAISTLNSVYFKTSLMAFFGKTVEYVTLYFVVVDTLNTKRRIKYVVSAIIISISALAIDAGFQYFKGFDLFRHFSMGTDHRLRASFSNANDMSGWLVLFTPLLILVSFFIEEIKLLKKIYLILLSFLAIICLVLGYSRGAFVGFFIALVLVFIYKRKKKVSLTPFLILIILFIILTPLKKEFYFNITSSHRVTSVLVRQDLWKRILAMIADYPLLGSGPSTYVPIIGRYSQDFHQDTSYPHNSYLHIAAEAGLAGLFAFIWIFVTLFNAVYRILKETKSDDNIELVGLLAGLVAFLVHSFFDTNLTSLQLATSFWLVVALTASELKIRGVS